MMDLYSLKIEVFDGWFRGQSERWRSAHGCRRLQSVNKSQRFWIRHSGLHRFKQ
jgi:hypothetical protein